MKKCKKGSIVIFNVESLSIDSYLFNDLYVNFINFDVSNNTNQMKEHKPITLYQKKNELYNSYNHSDNRAHLTDMTRLVNDKYYKDVFNTHKTQNSDKNLLIKKWCLKVYTPLLLYLQKNVTNAYNNYGLVSLINDKMIDQTIRKVIPSELQFTVVSVLLAKFVQTQDKYIHTKFAPVQVAGWDVLRGTRSLDPQVKINFDKQNTVKKELSSKLDYLNNMMTQAVSDDDTFDKAEIRSIQKSINITKSKLTVVQAKCTNLLKTIEAYDKKYDSCEHWFLYLEDSDGNLFIAPAMGFKPYLND